MYGERWKKNGYMAQRFRYVSNGCVGPLPSSTRFTTIWSRFADLLAKSADLGRGFRCPCRSNVSGRITLTGTYRTTALEFSCRPSQLMRPAAFTLITDLHFVCACHCYILSLHAIRKQPNLIHHNSSHDQRRNQDTP